MRRMPTEITLLLMILMGVSVHAYPVQHAVTLDELAKQSDVIFKGTVISSRKVHDGSFPNTIGFETHETVFQVVSVLKDAGKAGSKIRFRHFTESTGATREFAPQQYSFSINKTYIVCAKKVDDQTHLRHVWDAHRTKEDQGSLLCRDSTRHVGATLADAYWHELTALLRSSKPSEVVYAIQQLNAMTGVGHHSHQSLDREKAADLIAALISSANNDIAFAATEAIGNENPELGSDIRALIRLNPDHFPGYSTMEPAKQNASAQRHAKELISLADSNRAAKLREIAIHSLCKTKLSEMKSLLPRWLSDAESKVRAAATLLLADYTEDVSIEVSTLMLKRSLTDRSADVRFSATRSTAITQQIDLIDELAGLLTDADPKVVAGAAAALLAFPIDKSRQILKAHIGHPEYGGLFANALAREDTATYAEKLGQTIRLARNPDQWWGGRVPWGISWHLLFKYVQAQPNVKIRGGKLNLILASLESPVREHEQSIHYSSSEPRDLYALYVQRGMHKRAKDYRKVVNTKTRYDMDLFFNRVDQHPDHFTRDQPY